MIRVTFFLLIIVFNLLNAQGLIINELVSSNSVITDEDGDTPDWIELLNNSDQSIQLIDYYISDNQDSLSKWNLPDYTLEPDGLFTFFASGKNRRLVTYWSTVIDQGAIWNFNTSAVAENWVNIEYNDSSWDSGPTGIGYGDDDDVTILDSNTLTVYLRHTFQLSDTASIQSILLHVDFDDAYVAYLNGVEISRKNIGSVGIRPDYNQSSDTFVEAALYQGQVPERVDIGIFKKHLKTGNNVLAVEVHNHGTNSSDLSITPFLSFGYAQPQSPEYSSPLLDLSENNFHSNFKIKSSGEALFLSIQNNSIIDDVASVSIPSDHSYGRDSNNVWLYFENPTFNTPNISKGYAGFSDTVFASLEGGFHSSNINISLFTNSGDTAIYYTLDGSIPDTNSLMYVSSLPISSTTVVRARNMQYQKHPGPVFTEIYLINETYSLPLISLTTDPENLWDENTGIYTFGPNADRQNFPYFGANFWEDWEKPAHITFYEDNGLLAFKSNCGIKINGGWSRGHPQKSLALFFRGKYGNRELQYPLFPEIEVDEFQSFVLRNSGNDWNATMLRDGFMQTLMNDIDIDKQGYRPAIVYLNGAYWGIHNIREKVNEHFISSHNNIATSDVNLLENDISPIHGSSDDYEQIINYIQSNDMRLQSSYDFINAKIDLNEYLNYMCSQIYFDNTDWPGNNIKYWRSNSLDGKWRWILFDTDFGFGLFDSQAVTHNTLAFALENNPQIGWPNPPWSTFLFRKLTENEQIKNKFISRFADLLNSIFKPDRVLSVLDSIDNKITTEINRHYNFWSQSLSARDDQIQRMRNFAEKRRTEMQIDIIQQFSLTGLALVNINSSNGGFVRVNSLDIRSFPWQDYYFNDIPITLTAVPESGYTFFGWDGYMESNESSITVTPNSLFELTARFEPSSELTGRVVINEINYNSADNHNSSDWIEIYNNSQQTINLSGWSFTDNLKLTQFILPEILLTAQAYMVVTKSDSLFSDIFQSVENKTGDFDFNLSGSGETLYLLDNHSLLVDSVLYSDSQPWPLLADGKGHTLELKNPSIDNNLPENWLASVNDGTPGNKNSVFITEINNEHPVVLPTEFALSQNYPNPFNPSTKIDYTIKHSARVYILIHDLSGKVVKKIDRGFQQAGFYKMNLDTKDFASGVYFYSLVINAKRFNTKKMLKLK